MGTDGPRIHPGPSASAPVPQGWKPPHLDIDLSALPPLPPILDHDLARLARTHKCAAFTHVNGRNSSAHLAELESNGRLEWVGDSLLTWLVAARLESMLKHANSGHLFELRKRITSNNTLSTIARHYGLGRQLILGSATVRRLPEMEQKTLANAFEAHLGGVQLSSPDGYRISEALLTYIHVFVSPQVFPQLGDIEKQLKRVPERWEGEPGSKKRRIDEVYPVMGSLMFQPARDGVVEAGKPLDEHDPRAIREVFRSYRIVSQKEPALYSASSAPPPPPSSSPPLLGAPSPSPLRHAPADLAPRAPHRRVPAAHHPPPVKTVDALVHDRGVAIEWFRLVVVVLDSMELTRELRRDMSEVGAGWS
ncbi:ribonuclease III domain-containing protein [Rhodotorula diobovata]|uniref:Ribonuclease III domain-containing protein n=1 Tax=Rhodotorula diobovata TaxID=5288 RepID=A0A5C5G0S4_9BASI|nr:ribonuclease III domain-containing protein [Rhodotorula diobovata]